MESGDLKIFRAVAREGSISRAAKRLGYVQSNVTARIQHLEAELQVPLFHRLSRGVALTSAGENLLGYADRIVYLLDEAQKSLQFSETPQGPLKLGSLETTAAVHLPELMLKYHRSYEDVKLTLHTSHSRQLIQKVLQYELDGAFVNGPFPHAELEQILVFKEELVLVSESGRGYTKDLLEGPLLFFGTGCSHRSRLEKWLHEEQVNSPNIMEFGTLEAILGGVSAGLGVSCLPRSTVRTHEERGLLTIHPIPAKYSQADVYFIYRKDLFQTGAFTKFAELLHPQRAESNT